MIQKLQSPPEEMSPSIPRLPPRNGLARRLLIVDDNELTCKQMKAFKADAHWP